MCVWMKKNERDYTQSWERKQVAEIFTYIDDPDLYLNELDLDKAARVISYMDSDDAVDVLDELDDSKQAQLVELLDEESSHDIKMIQSYEG